MNIAFFFISKDTSALEDLPQRHHRTIRLDERQQIKAAKLTQNYKVDFIFHNDHAI